MGTKGPSPPCFRSAHPLKREKHPHPEGKWAMVMKERRPDIARCSSTELDCADVPQIHGSTAGHFCGFHEFALTCDILYSPRWSWRIAVWKCDSYSLLLGWKLSGWTQARISLRHLWFGEGFFRDHCLCSTRMPLLWLPGWRLGSSDS